MSDDLHGAILQRDKETYAIVPRTPCGMLSADVLEKVAEVVRKYEIPVTKITSGQRLALVGLKKEDIEPAWQELQTGIGRASELCLHYVQACPGTAVCKFGQQDSLGLGMEMEERFMGHDMPAKTKIGVSGCPFCCGESYVRCLGLIGKNAGWIVTFGGNSGGKPRIGDVIAEDVSKDEAVELVDKLIQYYKDNGKKKERAARFVERVGIESIKEAVLK